MTCNAVVKAFGAETREEAHLARILDQWRTATARMWIRGTDSANIQAAAVVVMRLSLAAAAIWLWCKGRAGPGMWLMC